MTNMEIVEKLALTSASLPLDESESWLALAAQAELEGHPDVADDLLREACRVEAEERSEREDAREYLAIVV